VLFLTTYGGVVDTYTTRHATRRNHQYFLQLDRNICSHLDMSILESPSKSTTAIQSQKLRLELKEWERSFAAANGGRKAGREDIKQHLEIGQNQYTQTHTTMITNAIQQRNTKPTTNSAPPSPNLNPNPSPKYHLHPAPRRSANIPPPNPKPPSKPLQNSQNTPIPFTPRSSTFTTPRSLQA